MKNKKGFSMITLIITIIVVIILTTLAIATSSDLPDKANYSKYVNDMENVQTGVENAKIKNARKGTSEEKLTVGFTKVYLEDAPTNFQSFGDIYEPTYGYLISLEEIGYDDGEYGKAYKNFNEGDTLKFGDKNCDVFVFDAKWDVFYVKGLKYDGSMNYTMN